MGHNLTEAEITSKGTAAMIEALRPSQPTTSATVDERMKQAVGSIKQFKPFDADSRPGLKKTKTPRPHRWPIVLR